MTKSFKFHRYRPLVIILVGLTLHNCNRLPESNLDQETSIDWMSDFNSSDCNYEIQYCDTCVTLSDFEQWETMRGAKEVMFDHASYQYSMGERGDYRPGSPGPSVKAFFYQDTSSFIKELSSYSFDVYRNPDTGKDTMFVTYFIKKIFFRSDYLEEHLKSNRFAVERRRSVGRLDTHLIENNIYVKDGQNFSFPDMYQTFLCLTSHLQSKYQTTIDLKPHHRKSWPKFLGGYSDSMYHYFVNVNDSLVLNIDNTSNGESITEINRNDLLAYKRFHVYMSFSEISFLAEEHGGIYTRDNTAIELVGEFNQSADGPLKKRLKVLTDDRNN